MYYWKKIRGFFKKLDISVLGDHGFLAFLVYNWRV